MPCAKRGGRLLYYQAMVWRQNGQSQDVVAMENIQNRQFLDLRGLASGQKYGIRVRYVNAQGAGPYSEDYMVTTTASCKSFWIFM